MSRNDEVDRTWPGLPCMSTCKTIRSDVVVAKTAAHTLLLVSRCKAQRLTQAISGTNDQVGRAADPSSKLKTWTEDTTMTEDKQCLQRVQRDH